MNAHKLFLSILLACLVLASGGCAAPASGPSPTTPIQSSTATFITTAFLPSAASLTPTASLSSTLPPTYPPTLTPTPGQRMVDMSLAGLLLEDFPPGFEVLDDSDQVRLGLTPDLLYQPFAGTFHRASPVSHFAFQTSPTVPFEVVLGVVFYPLEISEQVDLDHILAEPESTMANFSQGFGGQAELAPEIGQAANAGLGWTFTDEKGQTRLKGEMVIFRRGEAAAIMLSLYQADRTPPTNLTILAPRLAQRINQGLGY